ncbi:MAG: DUF1573 domain-containing protein [Planctomycetes bacterium]|nr:DUF1573 domain-containing protein [Planctomycetota bacterium]
MRPTLPSRSGAAILIGGLCFAFLPSFATQAQGASTVPAQTPVVSSAKGQTPPVKAPPVKQGPGGDVTKKPAPGGDPTQDPPDPNSKARITWEFGTDTHNFGKVMQGDVLNNTFSMKSSGEEDLVIKQAKPTCGCTVAQVACEQADGTMGPYTFGNPIPPGRKIEILATLHTQNKRGHASSRINMFTNDPRGQVSMGLEAEVDPFFQVNPSVINFNQVSSKDQVQDKATISTTRGERIKLTAVTDSVPPGVKIQLNPLDADAEGRATRYELVAIVGPGCSEGQLAYAVPIHSDLPIPGADKMPNGQAPCYDTNVTIMARVTGLISYTPQFISLGLIKPGQVKATSIRVTSHDPAFKLGELECEVRGRDGTPWEYSKSFQTFCRPVANENAVDIEVRLNGMPETLNGSFAGELLIKVKHPDKPELKLPITGVCRGGG